MPLVQRWLEWPANLRRASIVDHQEGHLHAYSKCTLRLPCPAGPERSGNGASRSERTADPIGRAGIASLHHGCRCAVAGNLAACGAAPRALPRFQLFGDPGRSALDHRRARCASLRAEPDLPLMSGLPGRAQPCATARSAAAVTESNACFSASERAVVSSALSRLGTSVSQMRHTSVQRLKRRGSISLSQVGSVQ